MRVLDLFIPKWRRYVCPLIIAPVRAALALAIGGKIATRTTVLVLLSQSHYRSSELAGSTRRALYAPESGVRAGRPRADRRWDKPGVLALPAHELSINCEARRARGRSASFIGPCSQ